MQQVSADNSLLQFPLLPYAADFRHHLTPRGSVLGAASSLGPSHAAGLSRLLFAKRREVGGLHFGFLPHAGERLRCVGQALSPNGIAFSEEGMVSLALLDKVLDIDLASGRVTVQAGARVQEVVEALRPHGLTLQNFASIREQSIGGYTQVRTFSSYQLPTSWLAYAPHLLRIIISLCTCQFCRRQSSTYPLVQ